MGPMRRPYRVLPALAVLLFAAVATAADVVIEDWKAYNVGSTGLPAEWKAQTWGTPNYQNIKVVEDDGHRALHLKSQNDSTTLNREIKGKVHLKDTPILAWEWKAIVLPKGYPVDEHLRLGPDYRPPQLATHFRYPADHGSFAEATEARASISFC